MRSAKTAYSILAMLVVAAGCSSATNFGVLDGGAADGGGIVATSDGGGTDAGKKKDSGKDTGVDEDDAGSDEDASVTTKDAGKKDSSVVVTPTCSPGAITGFSPTWKAPKAIHSSACTAANAQLAVDCAFDPNADPTTCNTFAASTANDACRQCVYSAPTDATYGPIVIDSNNIGSLNYAGCIAALSGNTTSSGCGAKVQAANQCEMAACTSCPDPSATQQALDDYNTCKSDARAGVCTTYDTAQTCADTLTATGGSAAACVNGTTFVLLARNLAKIFCSP